MNRRRFLALGAAAVASSILPSSVRPAKLNGKLLSVIVHNDFTNLLSTSTGAHITPCEYKEAVASLLLGMPAVLAQTVALPDPVIYRSTLATSLAKHIVEVAQNTWRGNIELERPADVQSGALRRLASYGTDPLSLTIEVCRRRGVLVVASYRMNAEDFGRNSFMLSDFGRSHPTSLIPHTGVLDPGDPAVFEHRRRIFREVAETYDIDGIEFDYMGGFSMISKPRRRHAILTQEVLETRRMLDEVAHKRRRGRMLLGVRVGASLDTRVAPSDPSCTDRGLDVRTWVRAGSVDYICPSYFSPRLSTKLSPGDVGLLFRYLGTQAVVRAEFAKLAEGTTVGIYPTLAPYAEWQEDPRHTYIDEHDLNGMTRLKDDLCKAALLEYARGSDGISTHNWVHHQQPGMVHDPLFKNWGVGSKKVQMEVLRKLGSPHELYDFLRQPM